MNVDSPNEKLCIQTLELHVEIWWNTPLQYTFSLLTANSKSFWCHQQASTLLAQYNVEMCRWERNHMMWKQTQPPKPAHDTYRQRTMTEDDRPSLHRLPARSFFLCWLCLAWARKWYNDVSFSKKIIQWSQHQHSVKSQAKPYRCLGPYLTRSCNIGKIGDLQGWMMSHALIPNLLWRLTILIQCEYNCFARSVLHIITDQRCHFLHEHSVGQWKPRVIQSCNCGWFFEMVQCMSTAR